MSDTIPFYINQVLNLFSSPWSIVLLIVATVLVIVVGYVPAARWALLAVLIYSTTFGVSGDMNAGSRFGSATPTILPLAFPLNLVQNNARTLTAASMVLMLLPTLMSSNLRRVTLFSGGFAFYFVLEMWLCGRLLLSGSNSIRGVLDFVCFLLMLATLVVGVGKWLQTTQDANALLKALVCFGALLVLGNIYELGRSPATMMQHRLQGTTSNPQALGQYSALSIAAALFLAQDKLAAFRWRVVATAVLGACTVLLLWSGSRTAMLMAVAGVIVVIGVRPQRLIVPAVGLLLGMWIGSLLFPIAFSGLTRFTDTSNDRAEAWSWMIQRFLENPVIGIGGGEGYRESFYLATPAYYGVIGAVAMLLSLSTTGLLLLRVVRRRALLGVNEGLVKLVFAYLVMIGLGGVFESSLLGAMNTVTILLYVSFALLAFCRDEENLQEQVGPVLQEHAGYPPHFAATPYGEFPAY